MTGGSFNAAGMETRLPSLRASYTQGSLRNCSLAISRDETSSWVRSGWHSCLERERALKIGSECALLEAHAMHIAPTMRPRPLDNGRSEMVSFG